jgi:cytochrome b subunit of formate dehydrogenase
MPSALTNTDRGIAGIILIISGIVLTKLGALGVHHITDEMLAIDTSVGQVFAHSLDLILFAFFACCISFIITVGLWMVWYNLFDDAYRNCVKQTGRQYSREDGDCDDL